MSKKNVKINYIWNLVFQLFLIIVPLIVTPYVSRMLGTDGIGKYSFSFSICYYFTLLALLGFNYYAQREIAKKQGDKHSQSIIFWEIVIVRFISTLIALGAYAGLIISNVFSDYNTLLIILGLNIVAVFLDPAFLFQGNEEFRDITIRNIIVKMLIVASIFIFVKSRNDLWIYTLINALSPVLTAIVLCPFLKKHLVKVQTKEMNPWKHIVPTLRLFIPTLAISIYVVLDKTMIGLLIPGEVTVIEDGKEVIKKVSDLENGYYEQADKIIKFAMTIVTSLSTVMIPHNSSAVANKDYVTLQANIYKAVRFTLMLAIPMTLGIIAISTNFSPWFLGPGYDKVPYLLMILSPVMIFIGLSGVFGLQYLIPIGKDNLFTISVSIGAAINLGFNILFIIFFKSYGAAMATILAEFSVLAIQFFFVKKTFSLKKIIAESWKYWLSGVMMFAIIFPISIVSDPTIMTTFMIIFMGVSMYFLILLVLKDKIIYDTLIKLREKITHKKVEE